METEPKCYVKSKKTTTAYKGKRADGKVPPLANSGKGITNADNRVSVCSDCRYGIFKSHTYHWTDHGLVHNDCNNKSET
jgi:hypothetical protein